MPRWPFSKKAKATRNLSANYVNRISGFGSNTPVPKLTFLNRLRSAFKTRKAAQAVKAVPATMNNYINYRPSVSTNKNRLLPGARNKLPTRRVAPEFNYGMLNELVGKKPETQGRKHFKNIPEWNPKWNTQIPNLISFPEKNLITFPKNNAKNIKKSILDNIHALKSYDTAILIRQGLKNSKLSKTIKYELLNELKKKEDMLNPFNMF